MFYQLSDPEEGKEEDNRNWFQKMFDPATYGYQGQSETQFDPAAHLPGADTRTAEVKKPSYLLMGGAAVAAFLILKKLK